MGLACLARGAGGGGRAVVSKPVDAGGAVGRKVVADHAPVARVENVGSARLVDASLMCWLFADLRGAARVHLMVLTSQSFVAFSGLPRLPSVVPAAFANLGGLAGANLRGATREKMNCFADIVLVETLRLAGSEEVALLAGVAARDMFLFTHVGGKGAVPGNRAVKSGVALSVVTRLAFLAEFRHVLAQADSGSPGSVIRVLAVHSRVALVAGRVEAGFAFSAHLRCAHAESRVLGVAASFGRRSQVVDTGARLSLGEEPSPVCGEVVGVARRKWGPVAFPASLTSLWFRMAVLADAMSGGPRRLQVVVVTRRKGRLVARFVRSTGAVMRVVVTNASAFSRSSVTGVVVAMETVVATGSRVSAGSAFDSHHRSAGSQSASERDVTSALVASRSFHLVGGRGRVAEQVDTCASRPLGEQLHVVRLEVVVVTGGQRCGVALGVGLSCAMPPRLEAAGALAIVPAAFEPVVVACRTVAVALLEESAGAVIVVTNASAGK